MAEWTHAQCERCWIANNHEYTDDGALAIRLPVRMKDPTMEPCCFCGHATFSGIYVRHDPSTLHCTHIETPDEERSASG